MDNLKDFTKAEFLSFLYAEKSREIENHSVPGWSKWALLGTIITLILYIYQAIISHHSDYDPKTFIIYLITFLAIVLEYLSYTRFNSDVRTFISSKVRPLIEEAPVLSYIFQFIICLICSLFQLYWIGLSFVFANLIIALALTIVILSYILINKNRFVLAQLKTRVFIKERTDHFVHFLLGCVYMYIIIYSIQHYWVLFCKDFHQLDFELAIGTSSLIIVLYWYIKLKSTNNKTLEGLDRIIDRFIIGAITQEEAYTQYIMLTYGYSAFQAINNYTSVISSIKGSYDENKKRLDVLEEKANKDNLSLDEIKEITLETNELLNFFDKSIISIQNALESIGKLLDLKHPQILDDKFVDTMNQLQESTTLISKLQEQTSKISDKVGKYFYESLYCNKYGCLCVTKECNNRKDCMPIRYKIKIWIWKRFRLLPSTKKKNPRSKEIR